jgi:hypothetical protein
MLKVGTLDDMIVNADQRILLCLSLPTSAAEIIPTPGLG